jgi:hypothetical protein
LGGIVAGCGGGSDDGDPDAGTTSDAPVGTEDPAIQWGAAGTGCPARPTSLTPTAVVGSSHGMAWEYDVSVRVVAGDGVARAYSSSAITLINQNQSVTPSSATAVTDPLYFELSNPTHDISLPGRQIGSTTYGPRRVCIDGVRGNIDGSIPPVGAEQAVVYTDVLPGSATNLSGTKEIWVYIAGTGKLTLHARSFDADVEIESSLGYSGTNSGGVADGTLGTGTDTGATIDAVATGPVHILRDPR